MNPPLGPNGLPLGNLGDPTFKGERVFVVTLKNWDDNDSLYSDMENLGGPLHVPNRAVKCSDRRPKERNTDYLLTHDEAVALSHDPRVAAVELNMADLGVKITRHSWVTTSTFRKSFAISGNDIDWGLFRTRAKISPPQWGRDEILNRDPSAPDFWGLTGSYSLNTGTEVLSDASGKNVDVIIVDGGIPFPVTLEYAQNPDGTGYPRMVQYDWDNFPGTTSSYSYNLVQDNNHQAHTSGTAAGNTQGHARDANIYNYTYADDLSYAKTFHESKTVNPLTGIKNPTITNNSWGTGLPFRYMDVKAFASKIHFRGTNYFPTSGSTGTYVWDDAVIQSCGIPLGTFGNSFPARNASIDANYIDAAKAGVINVCSAGNSFFYVAKPSSNPNDDYNNYIVLDTFGTVYYHRGHSPGSADEAINNNYSLDYSPICVGAMGVTSTTTQQASAVRMIFGYLAYDFPPDGLLQLEYKSEFSNYGPRVDVFAPGECTLSVINETSYITGLVPDPRATTLGITDNYNIFGRDAGTSMSGPHVCGVLACLLEKNPRMTNPEVREWISSVSLPTLKTTTGGAGDATDAAFLSWSTSSNKKIIFQQGTRVREAEVGGFYPAPYPTVNSKHRKTSGQVWPRTPSLVSYNNTVTLSLTTDQSVITIGNTATISLTTNLPDGTIVPYIISARMLVDNTKVGEVIGVSGVCTTSSFMTGSIENFNTHPNTGHRIWTYENGIGTWTSIPNVLLGPASLTQDTHAAPDNDDGYWSFILPWPILFNGELLGGFYLSANGYLIFEGGSQEYLNLGPTNPPRPKILISAIDTYTNRVFYGTEGTEPNRTYRIRAEGRHRLYENMTNPITLDGDITKIYELVFYENTPNQIDIQMGINGAWYTQGTRYNFQSRDIGGIPLTGNLVVSNGSATLPITIDKHYCNKSLILYVRTNTFPSSVATITVNP